MIGNQPYLLVSKALFGLRVLGRVLKVFIFWALILALLEVIVIATVSLGPRFGPMAMIVVPLAALSLAIGLTQIKPANVSRAQKSKQRVSRKIVALLLVLTLPVVAAAVSPTMMDHLTRSEDAESALQSFEPIYASDVDPARVERTLAEFERAHRQLADEWLVPESSPRIALHLFRDIHEYTSRTGLDWYGGHASCSEHGVTIGVPLEEAPSVLEEEPASRTPMHEMVHATWCQSLGPSAFQSIPRWFHEGMASRYQNGGFRQLAQRAFNRATVWLQRDDLLSAAKFCGYTSVGSRAEVKLIYGTAWEFIRSLEAGYGIHTLKSLLDDVREGRDFERSLRDRLGGTCEELYSEWSQSL